MFPNERDLAVSQEQYRDRLRAAERARLIRMAGLCQPNRKTLYRFVTVWAGSQLLKWGIRLPAGPKQSSLHPAGCYPQSLTDGRLCC